MGLYLVINPVASNLKDLCAQAVGLNDGNIASIEIIDLMSEQFSLNTRENVLSPRQVESYALISPYDAEDEEMEERYNLHGEEKIRA